MPVDFAPHPLINIRCILICCILICCILIRCILIRFILIRCILIPCILIRCILICCIHIRCILIITQWGRVCPGEPDIFLALFTKITAVVTYVCFLQKCCSFQTCLSLFWLPFYWDKFELSKCSSLMLLLTNVAFNASTFIWGELLTIISCQMHLELIC